MENISPSNVYAITYAVQHSFLQHIVCYSTNLSLQKCLKDLVPGASLMCVVLAAYVFLV